MEYRMSQIEKSRKIRQLFGFDKTIKLLQKKKLDYNEEVFFNSNSIEKDKISEIISNVVNSVSIDKVQTPYNKVFINISQNYFNSNINCIVQDVVMKDPNAPSDSKVYTTKSGNNISLDNYSTISTQIKPNQLKNSYIDFSNLNNNQKTYFFVPCINCNNLIHIDDIENHSNLCTRVKEEVIKVESSNFTYHSIDYKLRKFQEHLNKLEKQAITTSNDNLTKDAHYFSSMNKYIEDSLILSTINLNTVTALKKIVTNLNTFVTNFKGTFSTLIFIERTRVLILEKLNIIKEDLKKVYETNRQNPERKSGILSLSKLKDLESKKEEIIKERNTIENEKEFMHRKVANLKSSIRSKTPDQSFTNDEKSIDQIFKNDNTISELDLKKNIVSTNYRLEEINSDFEKGCTKDDLSGYTSMASNSVLSENEKNQSQTKDDIKSNGEITISVDAKQLYKEFVKVFLKVKFETLHSRHKGQNIKQNLVWKEALKKNIPKSEWELFITEELKNTQKYEKIKKNVSKK